MSKIISISNTKGGCGKSTLTVLISHYLSLKAQWQKSHGYMVEKVAVIDFDAPQHTTKTFFANRFKKFSESLSQPKQIHFDLSRYHPPYNEFKTFLEDLKREYHYIIIDSGGHHDDVTKLAIESADILITPVISTMLDLNVLFSYDVNKEEIIEGSCTTFVRRSKSNIKKLNWYVIPNKCSPIMTNYSVKCLNILQAMSDLIGFKVTSKIIDRSIYSQGFDMGLTCFDNDLDLYFHNSSTSVVNARKEISSIVDEIIK